MFILITNYNTLVAVLFIACIRARYDKHCLENEMHDKRLLYVLHVSQNEPFYVKFLCNCKGKTATKTAGHISTL